MLINNVLCGKCQHEDSQKVAKKKVQDMYILSLHLFLD